jgi:hypothetical protein
MKLALELQETRDEGHLEPFIYTRNRMYYLAAKLGFV